ncbi:hypothetical protein PAXINDRAFT_12655 [Paxillus involutus ATCC 200175]|uniref:Uncharacterized protein n=1 Tax=Paxillus involutus ATCC 200175 TaxID=664439 RepID=A0A0C9TWB9_PAXIN|nr:hypothetical protein PAXINDRAFT_12655 [Paxillus involutus ATCC 200175]
MSTTGGYPLRQARMLGTTEKYTPSSWAELCKLERVIATPQREVVEFVGFVEPEKVNGKEKKDKDESWAKLSRRISVTVGLTKNSKGHRRRSKEEKKEWNGTSTPPAATSASEVPEAAQVIHMTFCGAVKKRTI